MPWDERTVFQNQVRLSDENLVDPLAVYVADKLLVFRGVTAELARNKIRRTHDASPTQNGHA